MEESKKENKLYNVFLLGDIKSDKNKLIQQYILNNNQKPESNEENQKAENESEITQSFEIHGETIKMKILQDPKTDQIFSPNEENVQKPQGILLFYNVTDRDSFDKLKQIISNIFDMNKYEMPIVIVGNTSDKSERVVTFEEAKNFTENYGLKYHETTLENNCINMKEVFNDLGEQVLYQEIIEKRNEKSNEKSNEKNNEKEKSSNEKDTKNEKESDEGKSKDKFMRQKSKNELREKKTLLQKEREKEVREKRLKRENEMQLWYKKREREGIELKKKKALEDKKKLKEKIKEDKILQKQREKEVKENYLNEKKEKYEKSKKEKEEGEKKTILEKEKNKMLFEKKRKNERENLKKILEENEQNDREYIKQKRAKVRSPQSGRTRHKHVDSDDDNTLNKTVAEFSHEDKKKVESQTLQKYATLTNFYNKNTNSSKKGTYTKKTAKSKAKNEQKNEEIEQTEEKLREIKAKREEIEKREKEELQKKEEQMKLINDLKEIYINNNCTIYRCLYCYEIPIININEFNHQIEISCKCNKYNTNIIPYKYFEEKSLDHPVNTDISCIYCKKNTNELNNNNIYLNFCNLCNDIICSKDELMHKNKKHSNNKELKDKYKNLLINKPEKNKSKTSGNKNNLLTPSKTSATLRRKNQTPKKDKEKDKEKDKDKKQKDGNKTSKSTKKNSALSSAKKISSYKKTNKDSKKNEDSASKENNTEEIIERGENKNKVNEEKLPLYLNDSCCIEHGQIYNSYCHECLKNICIICEEKEHNNHNIEILVKEDEKILSNLKQSLEKDINDLKYVNNCFNELIEKIKKQFLYFYSLKQKEIEIKQKLITNYEIIKYNYNCIQNIYNINSKNNNIFKDSIISNLHKKDKDSNNDEDLLDKLKLIFNYLNESIEPTNLSNYYNNCNKILTSNGEIEITDIIKLDTNDLAVSFFNGYLNIYDSINFNQKLSCKIFENNKGINKVIQLKNGDLICSGFEKLKVVNINLSKQQYNISNEININNSYFNLIKELSNNYLITYDTNDSLKLWHNYKYFYEIINNVNIDSLLIIKDDLFISSSMYDKRLNLYNIIIDKNNSVELNTFSLDNISIAQGNNSMVKLNNKYLVVIYEGIKSEKKNMSEDEKFEECKNNEENDVENGIYLIEICAKNKLKIIQKINNEKGNGVYINMINYIGNNSVLLVNDYGYIELWIFDMINKKLNIIDQFKAVDNIYSKRIRSLLFIEDNKKILLQNYKNVICLSHE